MLSWTVFCLYTNPLVSGLVVYEMLEELHFMLT